MEYKELDGLMNVAYINFYTLGKKNPNICLTNINPKDNRHLACIHIAKLVSDIYGYKFYLPKDITLYWNIRWKCKTKKWLKCITRKAKAQNVDVEDFISHIENANGKPLGFTQLYYEYFKVFDR